MIKKVFLQATICLLLAACSNDPNPLVTGYGDVRFLLSVDPPSLLWRERLASTSTPLLPTLWLSLP